MKIEFGHEITSITRPPYVLEINDDADNTLKITVAFSRIDGERNEQGIKEILPDEDNVYEIIFDSYIIYQTRNESYASSDDSEECTGNYFLIFGRSHLLDYFLSVTDCQILPDGEYYPDEWKHYAIYSLNHVVDIISHCEPEIRKKASGKPVER